MFEWTLMKRLIWIKAAVISGAASLYETVTGAIVSFVALHAKALKKLVVNIDPVQDLHGYAAPWPPGGGVNKLPPLEIAGEYTDLTITASGETYILNGSPTAYGQAIASNFFTLPAGTYYFKMFEVSGSGTVSPQIRSTDGSTIYASTSSPAFTLAEETELKARFTWNSGAVANLAVQLMIASGSTEPASFAPYENYCPISGWMGTDVKRSGTNLFNGGDTNGYLSNTDGSISAGAGSVRAMSVYVPCGDFPRVYYYIEPHEGTDQNYAYRLGYYDENKNWIRNTTLSTFGTTTALAIPNNCKYIRASSWETAGRLALSFEPFDAYLPPTIDSRQINWQDDAGTVYGGTLTVKQDGSVELSVKWYQSSEYSRGALDSSGKLYKIATTTKPSPQYTQAVQCMCNILPSASLEQCRVNATSGIRSVCAYSGAVYAGGFVGDEIALDDLLPDIDIIYTLATPLTYSLDSITQLSTVVGTNNIWADAGDVEVTYYAK